MAGWYELNKLDNERFHFTLNAKNGEVILSSEIYNTRAAAHDGIRSVQSNARNAERYSREIASNGKFYFALRAGNNKIIGISQIYATEAAREAGIVSATENGVTVDIRDLA